MYQEFSAGPATALRLFANGDTLPDQQSRREHLGIKKKKCLGHKNDYGGVNKSGSTTHLLLTSSPDACQLGNPTRVNRNGDTLQAAEFIILHFDGNIGLYEIAVA